MKSRKDKPKGIIEILSDVVKKASEECTIIVSDFQGGFWERECPPINYTFGNSRYIKERLDELSETPDGNYHKFPLIALFCPFTEQRDSATYHTKAYVNLLIACSSDREWSNEYRLKTSFQNILRPIYRSFLEALKNDPRIDFGYREVIKHDYSENYSYGRYGAHAGSGEAVSEPIDAINISKLELIITNPTCR